MGRSGTLLTTDYEFPCAPHFPRMVGGIAFASQGAHSTNHILQDGDLLGHGRRYFVPFNGCTTGVFITSRDSSSFSTTAWIIGCFPGRLSTDGTVMFPTTPDPDHCSEVRAPLSLFGVVSHHGRTRDLHSSPFPIHGLSQKQQQPEQQQEMTQVLKC